MTNDVKRPDPADEAPREEPTADASQPKAEGAQPEAEDTQPVTLQPKAEGPEPAESAEPAEPEPAPRIAPLPETLAEEAETFVAAPETVGEAEEPKDKRTIKRFGISPRIEHIILLVTFTGLALTGLPQKYAQQPWADALIAFLGGIETVRIIHRVMATTLMAEAIYHGGVITFKLFVLREPPYLLPLPRDLTELIQVMAFNLGLRKEHPRMARFNFEEKLEYWAVIWGMGIMIATGFMLWNPIATTRFLPGEAIPAAKTAHGNEALLAVLAIITWHMYNVLTHGNFSIFTGRIKRRIMEEKHAEELAAIEAGDVPQPPPPDVFRRRMRIFIPVAIIIAGTLLAGLVWFVTFEQTAITTLPPTP